MEPSRLADAKSPFLRHGAEQPVQWWPWGEPAFEHARETDRPVLLDIGAVWCHWCHVMDRESYEDAATAEVINERFVPIKVDRDERPDVDARYQRAVQLLSGQGGWPLTAFLTSDGEVFYGGTYFPPEDMQGRPSFRRVLSEIDRIWREERNRAVEAAGSIATRLGAQARAEAEPGSLDPSLIDETLEELAATFDFRHGGFGRAPKFPAPGALDLLLDRYMDDGTTWTRQILETTLDAMRRGGVFDQIGGGFHRYSTDARWIIPHFEKMAYDNGPLMATYALTAAALDKKTEFAAVVDGIFAHYRDVAPDLLETGGFPASQDADFGDDNDGDYWTWTEPELQEALGDVRLVEIARLAFGFDDSAGRMHVDPSRHVLFLARDAHAVADALSEDPAMIATRLAGILSLLKRARDRRPAPFVDRTLYAGWCALVASGHILAARYLSRAEAGVAGIRALERIWKDGWRPDLGLLHRLGDEQSGEALEDQAHALLAVLDAFEYTQDIVWLERADAIARIMLSRFRDTAGAALADRPAGATGIGPLARVHRPLADAPTPSGNGAAALGLLRLAHLTADDAMAGKARDILQALAGSAARLRSSAATFVKAASWALLPVTTVLIVDEPGRPGSDQMLAVALGTFRPRTVVRRLSPANARETRLAPELEAMVSQEYPRAYLCAASACALPADTPDELRDTLLTFGRVAGSGGASSGGD